MDSVAPSPVTTVSVWDLPLRLFHWLLVATTALAALSGYLGGGWLEWHARAGGAIFALVLFRLLWGVLGSTHARFTEFFPSPARLRAYSRGTWRGLGHNPLGALAMLAILASTAAQAVTGLFANDEIAFEGPLASLVGSETSNRATWLHEVVFIVLLSLVALHLAAIAFHTWVGRQSLVLPMVTGSKLAPSELARASEGGGALRFLVALAVAAMLAWSVGSGQLTRHLAPPPNPSSPSQPAW
jgi:cytochrome b